MALLLVLVGLFLLTNRTISEEPLKLKIAAPEYICDKDGSVREVSKDMTTIRLLGSDAESVGYRFEVNAKRIGAKCRNSQRCTLLAWRAARELDQYLKNYPADGMKAGIIQINNTMFTPGIQYILNVTVVNKGSAVEEKRLILDYVDDEKKKNIQKPMVSLLLLGADATYAFTSYVINAEASICSDVSGYYLSWQLLNSSGKILQKFSDKTSELTLPPNTLQGLNTYNLKCELINLNSKESIANAVQPITTLSKGLILNLPLKFLTTNVNQPLTINAFVRDLDNLEGEIKVDWTCVEVSTNQPCSYRSETSDFQMVSGLPNEGQYKIFVQISKGNNTKSAACTVEVAKNAPTIEIEAIENAINPSLGLELHATVYELRTFCTLQWASINEDGYEFLNLNAVPGNVNEIVNVTLKEDLFLNELEEFSNGTIDKEHDLVVPSPSTSWVGLKGDVKYIFRLIVSCPSLIEDVDATNEPLVGPNQVVNAEIVIETNSAPKVKSLEVAPGEGGAFETRFSFKTQKAEDRIGDGPILYKFGYVFGQLDVIGWSLSEVTNAELLLPYSKDGLATFVEVCDNLRSCSRTFGPLVKTQLSSKSNSSEYLKNILEMFTEKINTEDYYKAFTFAMGVIETFKPLEDNTSLVEARGFINTKISGEIQKWLDIEEGDDETNWKPTANRFIKNLNEFSSELELDESVLNKLVELTDKLSDVAILASKYLSRQLLAVGREKRADVTLQDVRAYIEVSEMIISRSNDSNKIKEVKEKLRNLLHSYMSKLCASLFEKVQNMNLELKTMAISVEKLARSSFNNYVTIPFERNSWKSSAKVKLAGQFYPKNPNKLCLGKAAFRDYLGKSGTIYLAEIVNGGSDLASEPSGDVTVLLPAVATKTQEPTCLVYRNGWNSDCKVTQKLLKYVQCSCKYLGYYYLEYVDVDDPNRAKILPSVIVENHTTAVTIVTESDAASLELANGTLNTSRIKSSNMTSSEEQHHETISYIVIAASVAGVMALAFILRKILREDEEDDFSDTLEFPKYAQLYDEEMLNDAHI